MEKWDKLKTHLIKKKKERYENDKDWRHGSTLKEPFTIFDIIGFENQIGEPLPENLKIYLLYVSREFFFTYYPETFSLANTDIEEGMQDVIDEECDHHPSDERYKIDNSYTAYIGDDGCAFTYVVVLTGKYKGEVWYSDGDFTRSQGSFESFIGIDDEPPPYHEIARKVLTVVPDLNKNSTSDHIIECYGGSKVYSFRFTEEYQTQQRDFSRLDTATIVASMRKVGSGHDSVAHSFARNYCFMKGMEMLLTGRSDEADRYLNPIKYYKK